MPVTLYLDATSVMHAFCYAFSMTMLEKMQQLLKNNEVWLDERTGELTELARALMNQLDYQICRIEGDSQYIEKEALLLRIHAYADFLAIFTVQNPPAT